MSSSNNHLHLEKFFIYGDFLSMPIIVNVVEEKWFLAVSIGFSKDYKNLLNNTCKIPDRIASSPRSADTPAFKVIFMRLFC